MVVPRNFSFIPAQGSGGPTVWCSKMRPSDDGKTSYRKSTYRIREIVGRVLGNAGHIS